MKDLLLGNGAFHIPDSILQVLKAISTQLLSNLPNSRVWLNSINGDICFKSTYQLDSSEIELSTCFEGKITSVITECFLALKDGLSLMSSIGFLNVLIELMLL